MLNNKILLKPTSLLIKMLVIYSLGLAFTTSAIAETTKNTDASYGMPTHRRDGGSRGLKDSCIAQKRNLVALIPENTVTLNASASPKLFFYVPQTKQQKVIEFVLRNEQDELVYEAFLTTEGNGIISVEIPGDIQSNLLAKEQNYRWYLSMICNAQQRSRDVVVQGWLRQSKIDAQLQQQLNSSTAVEQASLYQKQGFWHDALSVLVETQKIGSDNGLVTAKWLELLASVNLSELASEPFVDAQLIKYPHNLEPTQNSSLPR
ncbi:MAG: hypothetical protein Tsb0014_10540 [Pleurocapsa sp.]